VAIAKAMPAKSSVPGPKPVNDFLMFPLHTFGF
jgi:hypothetical protein